MSKRKQTGFSLIELMITVGIVAILGSIAMSSYTSSVLKAKRTEGKTALFQLMQQEERFSTQNNTYIVFSNISTDLNEKKFKWHSGDAATSSAYQIEGTACAGETIQNCVLLTASPGTSVVDTNFKDTQCGKLTLTSTGIKGISGTGTKETCW